jgi:hypothetical protein
MSSVIIFRKIQLGETVSLNAGEGGIAADWRVELKHHTVVE